jgi:hypothetical protein
MPAAEAASTDVVALGVETAAVVISGSMGNHALTAIAGVVAVTVILRHEPPRIAWKKHPV